MRRTALIAALLLAWPLAAAAQMPEEGWRRVNRVPSPDDSPCIGNTSTPECAVDTLVFCAGAKYRNKKACEAVGEYASPGLHPAADPDLSFRDFRIAFSAVTEDMIPERRRPGAADCGVLCWYPGDLRAEVRFRACSRTRACRIGGEEKAIDLSLPGCKIAGCSELLLPVTYILRQEAGHWRYIDTDDPAALGLIRSDSPDAPWKRVSLLPNPGDTACLGDATTRECAVDSIVACGFGGKDGPDDPCQTVQSPASGVLSAASDLVFADYRTVFREITEDMIPDWLRREGGNCGTYCWQPGDLGASVWLRTCERTRACRIDDELGTIDLDRPDCTIKTCRSNYFPITFILRRNAGRWKNVYVYHPAHQGTATPFPSLYPWKRK